MAHYPFVDDVDLGGNGRPATVFTWCSNRRRRL